MANYDLLDSRIIRCSKKYHGRLYTLSVTAAVFDLTTRNPEQLVTYGGIVSELSPPPESITERIRNPLAPLSYEIHWLEDMGMISHVERKPSEPYTSVSNYERTDSGLWKAVPMLIEHSLSLPVRGVNE